MKRPIVHVPDAVLNAPTKPIVKFDKRVTRLIGDLKDTLMATTNPKGVGLAAPQIGEPWRVFVTRPKESGPVRAFINPHITHVSHQQTDGVPQRENLPAGEGGKLEGCLSIPKIWGKVKRAAALTLRYQDERGNKKEEKFSGFMATIIQHETDHVNGILFTHRILEQKQKLYQATTDTKGKEVLEEVTLP